jgi:hypothetical protein
MGIIFYVILKKVKTTVSISQFALKASKGLNIKPYTGRHGFRKG